MKKRTLKSLNLNKKSVSHLNLFGGSAPGPPLSRSNAITGCGGCTYSRYPCQEPK